MDLRKLSDLGKIKVYDENVKTISLPLFPYPK